MTLVLDNRALKAYYKEIIGNLRMTHETQTVQTTSFPEDSGIHRALAPTAEEIASRTAARQACEAAFREQWNQVSRQRHAQGKPASFRSTTGHHLTLLPAEVPAQAEENISPTASPVAELGGTALLSADI